jgi:hypothetical protein
MGWRALVIPVLAGVGLGVAACGGGGAANPLGPWYRDGYNFGVDEQGSPSVQAVSPTQFCNAALRAAAAAGPSGSGSGAGPGSEGAGRHPAADSMNVPRNGPPVSDAAADGAWLNGCVAGLASQ